VTQCILYQYSILMPYQILLYSIEVLLYSRDLSAVNMELLVGLWVIALMGLKVKARVRSLGLGSVRNAVGGTSILNRGQLS